MHNGARGQETERVLQANMEISWEKITLTWSERPHTVNPI